MNAVHTPEIATRVTHRREFLVDVVIPAHCADRSVEEAVHSASPAVQGIATRVIVVGHNLGSRSLGVLENEYTRIIYLDDGIPSPSGPRNAGLDAATAPFVMFLDSDDLLAPGCLRRLSDVAEETGADVVLPSIRTTSGHLGTPPTWSRKHRRLDAVRDGLFQRSHSFALIRRGTLVASGIRYPAGVRTGQDLVFMSQLYACVDIRLAFNAIYILREHGGERVTSTKMPSNDQVAAAAHILNSPWLEELSHDYREALVHRLLAVNLASAWRRRRKIGHAPKAEVYKSVRDLAFQRCPSAKRLLSVRDRATLSYSNSVVATLATSNPLLGVIPTRPSALLDRNGPVLLEVRKRVAARLPRR